MNTYIVWDNHGDIVLRDSVPKMYGRICEFMLEQYFKPNPIFNILQMQEEEGINEQYIVLLMHILRNECTIVAIDEKTNTIYAVALIKWMTKEWRSWVNLLETVSSRKLNDLITLWHIMILNYSREFPKHDSDSMHIFQYHIAVELRSDEVFMWKFFNAISEAGRHMKMPRVTCVSLSTAKQQQLETADYKRLSQIIYAMYISRDQQRPFGLLRNANEQIVVFYEKQLEPLIPYYDMPPFEPEPVKAVISAHVEPEVIPEARRRSSA